MILEEKNEIMANIKNFCAENSGNRLSPKWLIPMLIGTTGRICDGCIQKSQVQEPDVENKKPHETNKDTNLNLLPGKHKNKK